MKNIEKLNDAISVLQDYKNNSDESIVNAIKDIADSAFEYFPNYYVDYIGDKCVAEICFPGIFSIPSEYCFEANRDTKLFHLPGPQSHNYSKSLTEDYVLKRVDAIDQWSKIFNKSCKECNFFLLLFVKFFFTNAVDNSFLNKINNLNKDIGDMAIKAKEIYYKIRNKVEENKKNVVDIFSNKFYDNKFAECEIKAIVDMFVTIFTIEDITGGKILNATEFIVNSDITYPWNFSSRDINWTINIILNNLWSYCEYDNIEHRDYVPGGREKRMEILKSVGEHIVKKLLETV